jgi:hypothetical protein
MLVHGNMIVHWIDSATENYRLFTGKGENAG